ncbi:MAG: RNA polymerase sporulation sigma factor SigK [Clostridiales bacterium]|uniref:RNA polymerase sporulation sigma factor SigK n=1 Tax=Roseburia sp. MSJ-14 TaxID=2841514 RepID=UPI001691C045|nr:RNA polymerase sporulation sigma factor SigK [Roseburia sp. MSJ-14]MBU5472940.1 RNA polymerase sporulation sigma factor SigK [Roseburia sp. MSJ-14]NLK78384.1 RNA polymerase sporulation sigma factor SigK [Clostridiales bacterium]
MKTFLMPLNAEEEIYYLKKMKEGDLEAKYILIERNLRLVAHIAKKYQSAEEDTEDLISIGTIGLIKAVSTFKYEKGNRLATYAARCIDNELLMYFRAKKKTSREVSLYEPIGTDKEGNQINLMDVVESQEKDIFDIIELKGNSKRLYEMIPKVLGKREREIIEMRYGLYNRKPITQREIADKMGISRSYVSRIEKKALEKLRVCFEKV